MAKSIVGIAKSNLQVERTIDELQEDALLPVSEISVLIPESVDQREVGPEKATNRSPRRRSMKKESKREGISSRFTFRITRSPIFAVRS
jgi:hypothetical protein